MGTSCEGKALQQIKEQLDADCAALESGNSVSLLAKWLPSVNASNEDTVRTAKRIARMMGMNDVQYRKMLSALRAKIGIIENNLREKDYTFDYAKQPSKAMFKYRKENLSSVYYASTGKRLPGNWLIFTWQIHLANRTYAGSASQYSMRSML